GARVLGALGALALLIACIGIYGLMTYSVSSRRREIGIRVAIGAEPRQVGRMVLKEGALLSAIGLALGLAGALAVTRSLAPILIGVRADDPLALAGSLALLAASALVACWIPSRHAARLDPVVALRTE
ncbi:MAG TPA: FtsX-like permease family protein, partial [Thermoanaerobaculia bacterium]|nr:FtsX-like permease family protein [Thermoanaerobaculia bacterium]